MLNISDIFHMSLVLAELLLCYLTGNIFGVEISCGRRADDVWTTHESEILGEISLADDICHLHIVCMLYACRPRGMATALHKADWLPCCIRQGIVFLLTRSTISGISLTSCSNIRKLLKLCGRLENLQFRRHRK